jgi:outer membrane protein assembly factor BamB
MPAQPERTLRLVPGLMVMFGLLGPLGMSATAGEAPAAVSGIAAAPQPSADGLIASPEPGWPQWRGPRRDGICDEKDLLPTWPEGGPRLLWKVEKLGRGWSSPIVVGNRLYVTGDVEDDLVLFAFDLDGEPQWQATNGKSWTGSYPGARACCAYSEGKLYHMNAHGRVASFDAATGKPSWAVEILEQFRGKNITWALSECLLVDGPRVIVTPGGAKALMAALDKHSGQTVWTSEPLGDDRATHSSPILFRQGERRIVSSCSSTHGFGVDADSGKLLWTVPVRNQYETNVATPVYGGGRIFFVTAYSGGACYQGPLGDAGRPPASAWSTTLDTCTGAVLLVDGLLYGSGYRRHKSWLCLDWQSGELQYEFKELTTSAAVYADGRLYCLAEDGRAAMLRPSAGGCQFAGQFRLAPGKAHDAWAHPVLLGGRLYLRYHDTLWCFDVKGK